MNVSNQTQERSQNCLSFLLHSSGSSFVSTPNNKYLIIATVIKPLTLLPFLLIFSLTLGDRCPFLLFYKESS